MSDDIEEKPSNEKEYVEEIHIEDDEEVALDDDELEDNQWASAHNNPFLVLCHLSKFVYIVSASVFFALVLIIGISVPLVKRKADPRRTERYKSSIIMLSELYPDVVYDSSVFDDLDSPQSKAMNWIANQDDAELSLNHEFYSTRFALASLYFSTSEDSRWVNSTNWLSSVGYCDWHGVECLGDSQDDHSTSFGRNGVVWGLNLTRNGLQGILGEEIGYLERLSE